METLSRPEERSPNQIYIRPEMNAVLMGGGYVYRDCRNLLDLMLQMSGVEHSPRVLLMGTGAPDEDYFDRYDFEMRDALMSQNVEAGNITQLHGYPRIDSGATGKPFSSKPFNPAMIPSQDEIDHKFGEADVIYFIGGDTPNAKRFMDATGIGGAFLTAINEGTVIGGHSLGLIIQGEGGQTDTQATNRPPNAKWDYESCIGYRNIGAYLIPHYDTASPALLSNNDEDGELREQNFRRMLTDGRMWPDLPRIGIGVDNNVAIVLQGGKMRVEPGGDAPKDESDNRKGVFLIDWRDDPASPKIDQIPYSKDFQPLTLD